MFQLKPLKEKIVVQGGDVNKVLNAFYDTVNPTINYANKTNRKGAEDLINRFGLEQTLKLVESAVAVQGKPYAPVITTPYQLREKLSNLVIFYKSQEEIQNNKKGKKAVIAY